MNKLPDGTDFLPLDNVSAFEAQLDFLLEHELEATEELEETIRTIFRASPNFARSSAVRAKCNKLFVKYSELASDSHAQRVVSNADERRGCLSLRASRVEALSLAHRRSEDLKALERFCEAALEDPAFDGTADCIRMSVAVSMENLCSAFEAHREVSAASEHGLVS